MTPAQREHFDEAVAFVIKKLGCGPEVRAIFDRITELEQQNRKLETKVTEMEFELHWEQMNRE